jgi:hypothetical protein
MGVFRMRKSALLAATVAAMAIGTASAYAGLLDSGTNTVDSQFYLGAMIPADLEDEGTQTIQNPGGAVYGIGAEDESTIDVADMTITITNEAPFPFCSTSLPCPDSFTGFVFVFSSGVDISNVTVDPATTLDMDPFTLTFSATEIQVDLAGAADQTTPAIGDQLVLDLSFPASGGGGPTSVPEPSSLAVLGSGLAGFFIRRRRAAGKVAPRER